MSSGANAGTLEGTGWAQWGATLRCHQGVLARRLAPCGSGTKGGAGRGQELKGSPVIRFGWHHQASCMSSLLQGPPPSLDPGLVRNPDKRNVPYLSGQSNHSITQEREGAWPDRGHVTNGEEVTAPPHPGQPSP